MLSFNSLDMICFELFIIAHLKFCLASTTSGLSQAQFLLTTHFPVCVSYLPFL